MSVLVVVSDLDRVSPFLASALPFFAAKKSGLNVLCWTPAPSVTYPLNLAVMEARRGFTIADRHFTLEQITPLYLRLRASDQ